MVHKLPCLTTHFAQLLIRHANNTKTHANYWFERRQKRGDKKRTTKKNWKKIKERQRDGMEWNRVIHKQLINALKSCFCSDIKEHNEPKVCAQFLTKRTCTWTVHLNDQDETLSFFFHLLLHLLLLL